jgi:cytidylate kinase
MNMSKEKRLTIAIDGPAGAGKSTTARLVAYEMGFVYVDSGAMYRALAWKCIADGIPYDNPEAVLSVCNSLEISFEPALEGSDTQRVFVGGVDVTDLIRTSEVSNVASATSVYPDVRDILVAYQREIGLAGGVVMEGRDIGTVVLPDAEVKVFLTASLEERARRRYVELEQKGTVGLTLKRVRAEIAERDERDSTRAISPLMPASDAVVIDSEALTARQVVETILDLCSARRKSASANRDRLP